MFCVYAYLLVSQKYRNIYTFGREVYREILSFVSHFGRLPHYPTEPNVHYLIYEFPQKLSDASAFARLVIINLKAEVWKCQESCVIL